MERKQMREFINVSATCEPLFDNGCFLSLPDHFTDGSAVFLDVLEYGSTLLRRLYQRLLEQVSGF